MLGDHRDFQEALYVMTQLASLTLGGVLSIKGPVRNQDHYLVSNSTVFMFNSCRKTISLQDGLVVKVVL